MKRLFAAALAALALAAPAGAAAPTAADVEAVRAYIEANKAYSPAARAEALRRSAALPALLADSARFELEVARIVALSDNGHSSLFPGQWPSRYPRSPIRFGRFADGLYVIAAPQQHRTMVGRRVVAINGKPWRQIGDAYAAYQGGSAAFREQFATLFLETPALLSAAGFGERDSLAVRAEGANEVRVKPELAPVHGHSAMMGGALPRAAAPLIKGQAPLYLRNSEMFDRTALPELDGTYVRIDEIHGDGLQPFLDATLEDLRRVRPHHLILDLRFNMGGDLNKARAFAQALPALVPGQIYAITSGRTFSAAISTLGYLKQAAGNRLTIVGEPLGDRLEFWAEGGMAKLPGLGAYLSTATERHNYVTGCPEADCHSAIRDNPIRVKTLDPDLAAPLTFADYTAGRDPAMEAIAADVKRRRSAR